MNVDLYFEGLKRKYGDTQTLSKLKERYCAYLKEEDTPFSAQKTFLHSIKASVKAQYELGLLREECKNLLRNIVGNHEGLDEKAAEIVVEAKPVLEDLFNSFNIFKEGLEKLSSKPDKTN